MGRRSQEKEKVQEKIGPGQNLNKKINLSMRDQNQSQRNQDQSQFHSLDPRATIAVANRRRPKKPVKHLLRLILNLSLAISILVRHQMNTKWNVKRNIFELKILRI